MPARTRSRQRLVEPGAGRRLERNLLALGQARCGLLVGKIAIRSERLRVPFKVERSRCGDFMIDEVVGEQCEPPGTTACDEDCHVVMHTAP